MVVDLPDVYKPQVWLSMGAAVFDVAAVNLVGEPVPGVFRVWLSGTLLLQVSRDFP